jgi:hypothetical protein
VPRPALVQFKIKNYDDLITSNNAQTSFDLKVDGQQTHFYFYNFEENNGVANVTFRLDWPIEESAEVKVRSLKRDAETPSDDSNGKDKNDDPKKEADTLNDTLKIGLDKENFLAYMTGYEDGTIRPENNITRAEAATIFYRLLLPEVREKYYSTENEFIDVDSDQWHNVYISTLCNAKILSGYDNTFKPDKNLTRAEMVKIICQFEEINGDYETLFIDIENHWAEKIINFAAKSGWINGYPDKTFRPDSDITRAEAAVIINNYLGRTVTEADMQENINQWKDNTEDKWYYEDILKATN